MRLITVNGTAENGSRGGTKHVGRADRTDAMCNKKAPIAFAKRIGPRAEKSRCTSKKGRYATKSAGNEFFLRGKGLEKRV